MFGSTTLEIATGIVLLYLLISLICSVLTELAASILNWRGQNLKQGILNLLNDPQYVGLAQQLYSHGLIAGISKNATDIAKINRDPSYISSGDFSRALLDVLTSRGAATSGMSIIDEKREAALTAHYRLCADQQSPKLQAEYDKAQADLKSAIQETQRVEAAHAAATKAAQAVGAAQGKDDKLSRIDDAAKAFQQALTAGRLLAAKCPSALINLQHAVDGLPDGHTKESLRTIIDDVQRSLLAGEQEYDKLRQGLEHWFDDAMDRFSGWYKRNTGLFSLCLGAILVVLLNADTVAVADKLSKDSALRSAAVSAAETAVQSDTDKLDENRHKLINDVLNVGLPLGWNDPQKTLITASKDPIAFAEHAIRKCLGLAISIIAISLGAPFWFDTLRRFVNVRGSGPKPKKGGVKNAKAQTANGN
jgi:hypothetical protein